MKVNDRVNTVNAFAYSSSGRIVTGTSRWFDAGADGDVDIHELGHLAIHQRIPLRYARGEVGGAIHEGVGGDTLMAFITLDPANAESWPGGPIRTLDNRATVRNTSSEVHARGTVYGGLMWDVAKALDLAKEGTGALTVPNTFADLPLRNRLSRETGDVTVARLGRRAHSVGHHQPGAGRLRARRSHRAAQCTGGGGT